MGERTVTGMRMGIKKMLLLRQDEYTISAEMLNDLYSSLCHLETFVANQPTQEKERASFQGEIRGLKEAISCLRIRVTAEHITVEKHIHVEED